jgi:hypothetical protein
MLTSTRHHVDANRDCTILDDVEIIGLWCKRLARREGIIRAMFGYPFLAAAAFTPGREGSIVDCEGPSRIYRVLFVIIVGWLYIRCC